MATFLLNCPSCVAEAIQKAITLIATGFFCHELHGFYKLKAIFIEYCIIVKEQITIISISGSKKNNIETVFQPMFLSFEISIRKYGILNDYIVVIQIRIE